MDSGQVDNKHVGKGGDERYTYTGSHRRAGRGEREVGRTGDRVHCAAASATYGRVAQPRHRGQGTRENPLPVLGRAAPHALAAAPGTVVTDVQVRVARCVNEGEVDALTAPAAARKNDFSAPRAVAHVTYSTERATAAGPCGAEAPAERPRAALWAGARQPWFVRVIDRNRRLYCKVQYR